MRSAKPTGQKCPSRASIHIDSSALEAARGQGEEEGELFQTMVLLSFRWTTMLPVVSHQRSYAENSTTSAGSEPDGPRNSRHLHVYAAYHQLLLTVSSRPVSSVRYFDPASPVKWLRRSPISCLSLSDCRNISASGMAGATFRF